MIYQRPHQALAQSGDAEENTAAVVEKVLAVVETKMTFSTTASCLDLNIMLCRVLRAVLVAKPSTVPVDLAAIPSIICQLLVSAKEQFHTTEQPRFGKSVTFQRESRSRSQEKDRMFFDALLTLLLVAKQGRDHMHAVPLARALKTILSFWVSPSVAASGVICIACSRCSALCHAVLHSSQGLGSCRPNSRTRALPSGSRLSSSRSCVSTAPAISRLIHRTCLLFCPRASI